MIKVKCKNCGKEFDAYLSTKDKKKYCSTECRKRETHIEVKCILCDKIFFVAKSKYYQKGYRYRTCSSACYEKLKKNRKQKQLEKKTFYCFNCGKEFVAYRKGKTGLKFCSQYCSKEYMVGNKSPFYSGGVYYTTQGYRSLKVGDKYILEHRLLVEEHVGRKLLENEVVHHIDGNKLNNKIENLKIMDRKEHDRFHTTERHKFQKLFKSTGKGGH